MGRSGYSDDWDGDGMPPEFWQQAVAQSIKGKRGQAFLRELATAMDAMTEKRLIAEELVTPEGECCTMGVICKARGLDLSEVDPYDREQVAKLFNIAPAMAAEIAHENDRDFEYKRSEEIPEKRWVRMRKWVRRNVR